MHSTETAQGQTESIPAIPTIAFPLLSAAAFSAGMAMRVTDPLLPLLSRQFGVSLGDAANVITAYAVAYGVAQLLFGPAGDRYGKYLVIAWACAASALASLLCALAPGYGLLIVARALAGTAAAAIIPLSMAWIGDVVPYERRQTVLARFLVGQILGLCSGALAGGLAADSNQWRLPFFGMMLICGVVCVALFAQNRQLPPHARAQRKEARLGPGHAFGEFRKILALPWARVVLIHVFLEGATLFGAFAFVATHLHAAHGLSLTTAGVLVMLFGAGGLLFAVASRRLVHRLGESGLVLWGGLLVGLSLLAIGVSPAWWWAIPACLVAGLGFYMLHNTLQTNATQMAPERRGSAVSAFASCFFMGQSLGIAAAGLMLARAGTSGVLATGGVCVLLVALSFRRRLAGKP